jgi:hypothetical protein
MKFNKIKFTLVVGILVIISFLAIYFRSSPNGVQAPRVTNSDAREKSGVSEPPHAQATNKPEEDLEWIAIKSNAQKIKQTPINFATSSFKLFGRGSNAKIVQDTTGKEITPGEGRGIYGSFPSPNGKNLLVYFGDADYDIRYSDSDKKSALPRVPSVPNPVGFEWQWLSDNLLVGIGGVGYNKATKTESKCCDQHTVAESVLCIYRVSDSVFRTVILPDSVKGKVFSIGTRTEEGDFELISSSGHEDEGKSLGWFAIKPKIEEHNKTQQDNR